MTNIALPITPDERIKLYDWVQFDDKVWTRLHVPAPKKSMYLVTKILLLKDVIRIEICHEPGHNQETSYAWWNAEDLIVVLHA